jgi:hypothetical protein
MPTFFSRSGSYFEAVLVSNSSSSGSDRELEEVPTGGDPPDPVQIRSSYRVLTGERQRRVALQRCVRARRVVVTLELGKVPFQITFTRRLVGIGVHGSAVTGADVCQAFQNSTWSRHSRRIVPITLPAGV